MTDSKNETVRKILLEKFNIEVGVLDVFPGADPDATPAQIAGEIAKSLEAMANGDYEEMDFGDEFTAEDRLNFKEFFNSPHLKE